MNHILQPSNAGRERPGQVRIAPTPTNPLSEPARPAHLTPRASYYMQVGYPAPKRARLAENAVDTTAATVDDILDRGASRPAGPHTAAQSVE